MSEGLTTKQKRFVKEYAKDCNATQAMIRAGYSADTAEASGSRMLRNVKVRQAVDGSLEAKTEEAEEVRKKLIQHIGRYLFTPVDAITSWSGGATNLKDSKDIPKHLLCFVESIEENVNAVGHNLKIKFSNRLKAAELLGRLYGLFIDRVEHSGPDGEPIEVKNATTKEVIDTIKAVRQVKAGLEK